MPRHKQVPFRCYDGTLTHVDVGMYDILTELHKHSVKTYFSCEGEYNPDDDDRRAYILLQFLSARRLINTILASHRRQHYSPEVMSFIAKLLNGYGQKYFEWFSDDGRYRVFNIQMSKNWDFADYAVELGYSNSYGLRLTLRWPLDQNGTFLQMLKETPRT